MILNTGIMLLLSVCHGSCSGITNWYQGHSLLRAAAVSYFWLPLHIKPISSFLGLG